MVFGDGLNYSHVTIHERTRFPDWIADVGAALRGRRRRQHNAVTLGNTSYFPVTLKTSAAALTAGDLTDLAWLIHELAHQWQFQRTGWIYLWRALKVQLREGPQAYIYKGAHPTAEAALRSARAAQRCLADFNPEQQGDLARDYYLALKQGRDASPWEPFVEEFRAPPTASR